MTPKQRRDAALLKQQAIVNAAKADGNRSLTAEEQAEFESCQREIEQADAEIAAQERGLSGGTGAITAPPAIQPPAGTGGGAPNPSFVIPAPPRPAPAQGERSGAEAERSRVTEILSLCRDFEIDPAKYIQNGSSLEQVRAAILESMKQTHTPISVQGRTGYFPGAGVRRPGDACGLTRCFPSRRGQRTARDEPSGSGHRMPEPGRAGYHVPASDAAR